MENQKYYSKLQLAMQLNVCTRTVDNWMARGQISYSKLGKRVIFSQDDMDAFVQKNHIEAFAKLNPGELLSSVKKVKQDWYS